MKTAPIYPAVFSGLTLDQVNDRLRLGLASKAEAAQYVQWWNESGKRFTTAELGERAVTVCRCQCIAPFISIRD